MAMRSLERVAADHGDATEVPAQLGQVAAVPGEAAEVPAHLGKVAAERVAAVYGNAAEASLAPFASSA